MVEVVQAAANTDREIWREGDGDYYAPSIHVTAQGSIGINVGGHVIVKDVREWHRLAHLTPNTDLSDERAREVLDATVPENWMAGHGEGFVTKQQALRAMHQYAAGLQGEVERLREALAAILDAPMIDHSRPERSAYGIARTALGDTQSCSRQPASDSVNRARRSQATHHTDGNH